ncbi:PREDICTED: uncharacterized protein LOC106748738 [Dinoponera quadriceps]|uniref:Gustatory receptor n=1 Tax=Dinoponera quadriceps TaxID=609295 RepID=A0A6P3XYA1_DINQU|nr:PREDICTED: uncharacterized protein LOC106748738 [Dinoponera quadriceps]
MEYPRGKLRTVLSLIYLLLLLSVFCTSAYIKYNYYFQFNLPNLEQVLYQIFTFLNIFVTACKMILGYFYTKTVNECYRKLAQIDETLQQLGSMFNYAEIYLLSIGAVIIWFLYVFCSAIVIIMDGRESEADLAITILILIWEIYGSAVSLVIAFEFSIFMRYLQTRFKLANDLLRESVAVSTTEGKKLDVPATEDYNEIMDSKQGPNIISIKVSSQLGPNQKPIQRFTFSPKINYDHKMSEKHTLIANDQLKQWQVVINGGLTFVMFAETILGSAYMLEIILIKLACKHATNEGKKTSAIIHEIYGCCPDIDIRNEVTQNPIEFSTFDIFLHYQILSSCLKSMTIYIVIMIEMSNYLGSS